MAQNIQRESFLARDASQVWMHLDWTFTPFSAKTLVTSASPLPTDMILISRSPRRVYRACARVLRRRALSHLEAPSTNPGKRSGHSRQEFRECTELWLSCQDISLFSVLFRLELFAESPASFCRHFVSWCYPTALFPSTYHHLTRLVRVEIFPKQSNNACHMQSTNVRNITHARAFFVSPKLRDGAINKFESTKWIIKTEFRNSKLNFFV